MSQYLLCSVWRIAFLWIRVLNFNFLMYYAYLGDGIFFHTDFCIETCKYKNIENLISVHKIAYFMPAYLYLLLWILIKFEWLLPWRPLFYIYILSIVNLTFLCQFQIILDISQLQTTTITNKAVILFEEIVTGNRGNDIRSLHLTKL